MQSSGEERTAEAVADSQERTGSAEASLILRKKRHPNLVFVDCGGYGPCPAIGRLRDFGGVLLGGQEFHGVIAENNEELRRMTSWDYDRRVDITFREFDAWLHKNIIGQPVFVSDNPAYDWQWINDAFHRFLGYNPFGHSARRIGDFYAGLKGNFRLTQRWKRFRVTKHDHNSVHDARGNMEAFTRLIAGEIP